jgi:hypothetical protein
LYQEKSGNPVPRQPGQNQKPVWIYYPPEFEIHKIGFHSTFGEGGGGGIGLAEALFYLFYSGSHTSLHPNEVQWYHFHLGRDIESRQEIHRVVFLWENWYLFNIGSTLFWYIFCKNLQYLCMI